MSNTETLEDLAPLERIIRKASDPSEVQIDTQSLGLPPDVRDQLPRRTLQDYERSLLQVRQQLARQRTLELAENVIEMFLSIGGVRLKIDRERPFVLRKKRGRSKTNPLQRAASETPADRAGTEEGERGEGVQP